MATERTVDLEHEMVQVSEGEGEYVSGDVVTADVPLDGSPEVYVTVGTGGKLSFSFPTAGRKTATDWSLSVFQVLWGLDARSWVDMETELRESGMVVVTEKRTPPGMAFFENQRAAAARECFRKAGFRVKNGVPG